MRKMIFSLVLGVVVFGISPVFATMQENETIDISSITPIKSGMNSGPQRREAIQAFLKDSLKPEYELQGDKMLEQHVRKCGVKECETYTLEDGSEWVQGSGGLNRFLGHLYLKKAIEHYNLETLRVVETRYVYINGDNSITVSINPSGPLRNVPVIDSKDFLSFSRYIGDERPVAAEKEREELEILRTRIGFTDMAFYGNLRRYDGKIYIIDTEYGSFSSTLSPYFENHGELSFTFPVIRFE